MGAFPGKLGQAVSGGQEAEEERRIKILLEGRGGRKGADQQKRQQQQNKKHLRPAVIPPGVADPGFPESEKKSGGHDQQIARLHQHFQGIEDFRKKVH